MVPFGILARRQPPEVDETARHHGVCACGEAHVLSWWNAEEDVDPGFDGLETGGEALEASVGLPGEQILSLREADLVDI